MVARCCAVPLGSYPGQIYDEVGLTGVIPGRSRTLMIGSLSAVIFGIIALSLKAHPTLSHTAKLGFMGAGISALVLGTTLIGARCCFVRPRHERRNDEGLSPYERQQREHEQNKIVVVRRSYLSQQNWTIEGKPEEAVENPKNEKCPISLEPLHKLQQPCFFAEDGYTYEAEDLINALGTQPGKSPIKGKWITDSPTLVNYRSRNFAICPITKESFKEAYFCIENGFTYEKSALEEYVKEYKKQNSRSSTIPSPGKPSINLSSITIYPNIALSNGNIPKAAGAQEPLQIFG